MMNRITSTLSLLAYTAVILGSVSAVTLGTTGYAMANSKCGGNNQRVCKKWEQLRGCDAGYHRTKLVGGKCTRDNKLIPDVIERKLVKLYEPGQRDCGGNNQRVCRKNEQLRGCDPGFHRTSPIKGICTTDNKLVPGPFSKNKELKQAAKEIARGTVAHQRVLTSIVSCIGRNKDEFRRAVKSKDRKAASAISFRCIDTNSLSILRSAPTSGVSNRGLNSGSGYFKTLSIGVGGSAIVFVGGGAESGIVFALDGQTLPRFYTAGGVKWGAGIGASLDVIVGLSEDALSAGKNYNWSLNVAADYTAGAGLGVVFDKGLLPPSLDGISVSAGGGLSVELGVINNTWSRIY